MAIRMFCAYSVLWLRTFQSAYSILCVLSSLSWDSRAWSVNTLAKDPPFFKHEALENSDNHRERHVGAREQLQHKPLISGCHPVSDYFSVMECFPMPWNHTAVKHKQAQSSAVVSLTSLVPSHQTWQSSCSPPALLVDWGWRGVGGLGWGWVRAWALALLGTSSHAIQAHAHEARTGRPMARAASAWTYHLQPNVGG